MGRILAIVLCSLASEVTEPRHLPDALPAARPTIAPRRETSAEAGHLRPAAPASETSFTPKPLVPVHRPPQSASSAVALIKEAMTRSAAGQLVGRDVSLYNLLVAAGPVPRGDPSWIHRYWRLATTTARYRWTVRLQARVRSAQPDFADDRSGQEAAARWLATLAAARADVQQARLDAVAAQYALADPQRLPAELPLPVDLPHAGRYRTRYHEIFRGRPPMAAYRIDQTLPLQYDLLRALAQSVATADVCFEKALGRIASSGDPAVDLRPAYRTLVDQRTRFLQAVLGYNNAIADYALLVAPAGMPPARLVTMLIPVAAGPVAPSPDHRFTVENDGLTSVLKRKSSVPTIATPDGRAGVVQATAETPITVPHNAQPPAKPKRDPFVPRRPGLDP